MIRVKRVYEEPSKADGFRVLVDRLWPRGFTKDRAAADLWLKDVAPSTELREWFGHDPAKWDEFRRRYRVELSRNLRALAPILARSRRGTVTLVYAAREEEHNAAVALREYLREHEHPRRKAA
jgi:uncharacterized protein YeaO (DUF488 family)